MSTPSPTRFAAAVLVASTVVARQDGAVVPSGGLTNVDWPVYRGDRKGNQYSALAQIHAANVHRLERAWEYKTGDVNQRSTMHANPIVVGHKHGNFDVSVGMIAAEMVGLSPPFRAQPADRNALVPFL